MLRFVWSTFRARWRTWMAPSAVAALASSVVGVCVAQHWSSYAPAVRTAAADAGIDVNEVAIAAATTYVLTAIFGILALNTVGAAAVESQRRVMAQWRLAGASPGQVRRLVTGLVGLTALIGAVPGLAGAWLLTPWLGPVLNGLASPRLTTVPVTMTVVPALVTVVVTVGTCWLGAARPALAASRVPPVEAVVDSPPVRRRPGAVRWALLATGAVLVGTQGVVLVGLIGERRMAAQTSAVINLGLTLIVALGFAGPFVAPGLLQGWSSLPVRCVPTWSVARRSALARSRRTASTIVPPAAGLALLGTLVGAANTSTARYRAAGGAQSQNLVDTWVIVAVAMVLLLASSLAVVALTSGQRQREFAMLRTAGATPAQLWQLVLLEAGFYSLTAACLGVFLTVTVVFAQAGLYASAGFAFDPCIPWVELGVATLGVFGLTTVAVLVPARSSLAAPSAAAIHAG